MPTIFTDNFTGTDGAAWSSTNWAAFVRSASAATSTISSNRGMKFTANTANQYIYNLANVSDVTDDEITWSYQRFDDSSRNYIGYTGINISGTITGGSGGGFTFTNGAWVEIDASSGTVVLKYKNTTGTVQTVAQTLVQATGTTRYYRLKKQGSTLYLRQWTTAGSEPGTWDHQVTMSGPNTPAAGKPFTGIHNKASGSSYGPGLGAVYWDDFTFIDNGALNVNFPAGTGLSASITAPNATVSVTRNVTYVATAATQSVTAPNATAIGGSDNTWTAPVVTASLDVVEPDFRILQTWNRTLDDLHGQVDSDTPGSNDSVTMRVSTTKTTFVKFDTSMIPADSIILDADISITASYPSGSGVINLKPVTSDFNPATVIYGTKPSEGSTFASTSLIGSTPVTESFDIDDRVAAILAGSEFGISLSGTTISTGVVTDVTLTVSYMAIGDTTVELDYVTIGVTAPDATVFIDSSANVTADAVTLDVATPNATVSTTGGVTYVATPATISVEAVDAFVGSPSVTVTAEVIEMIIYTPNANAYGGEDVTVVADTANITLEVNDVTISFDTDVMVQASAALINVKMIGLWSPEEDRYYQAILNGLEAPLALGNGVFATDQWFRFEESSGTEAADNWLSENQYDDDPATYYGSPTLRLEAPDLRHAVGLDGVNDWIDLPDNTSSNGGWSTEFVFRTSASNGVIWSNANGSVSLEVVAGKLQLVDYGTSNTNNPNPTRYNMTGTVNDGQWHHVVVSAPNPDLTSTRAFIMLDGERVFGRISNQVFRRSALPSQVGVRNPSIHDTSRLGFLAADFMEFTVRGTHYISEDEAFANYLEFTGAFIYRAPVLGNVTVEAPAAFGRGNQKKMLLLWGFPSGRTNRPDLLNIYQSVWSGVIMPTAGPNVISPDQPARVGTFDWKGYKVYPVHMWDRTLSVEGTVEQQSDWDNETGTYEAQHLFLDNESGESRLIDLSEDLLVDVREFDVIHVLNWPDKNITMGMTGTGVWASNIPLTEANYDAQIEQMKQGIRSANDEGVGLWIAEPQQAVDFGIIQDWVAHGDFMASGQFNPGEYEEFMDVEIGPTRPDSANDGIRNTDGTNNGRYDSTYGVRKRRIVATASDFSEFETWYRKEYIAFHKDFRQAPYADTYAHNLEHLEDGLTIGSEIDMDVWWLDYRTPEYGGPIVSAKPEGIVGTIIAREQEQYCKDATPVDNPYKDNVTTILVERGEVLQGSATGGRIFVELMDNSQAGGYNFQHGEAYRNYLGGAPAQPQQKQTEWDFDSRRSREIYSEVSFNVTEVLTSPNGRSQRSIATQLLYQTFTINDIPGALEVGLPYVGMNDRGLNWLSVRPWEDDDTTRVFATAAKIDVAAPGGTVDVIRNVTFTATPVLARVDVPTVYDGPNVEVQAGFPAEITVVGGAYVKAVIAEPAVITVETPNATATAEGEDLVFYFDYPEYTFYLKEEA